jgi:ubiquinol-cytochrome c reductase cytochrome b subunit
MAERNWTRATRNWIDRHLPNDRLLPDTMPSYVHSYVYLFGVLTIGSLVWVIATGTVLAIFGPDWWHISPVGHFFNSMHFWSVQTFFFFMILHLWAQFLMAAWRGGRHWTWIGGWVLFLVSILAAFTGYLSQTNFDAQWIGVQGKDAMNAAGIGGFFDLLNFGQMYGFHIFVLPATIIFLLAVHLILVRKHGVVPPIPDSRGSADDEATSADTYRPDTSNDAVTRRV